jgi:hypothetical protein
MNRKDLKTLSESYERIFENTMAGIIADESEDFGREHNELSNDVLPPQEAPSDISIGIDGNDGSVECDETKSMNITNTKALIAQAGMLLQSIESGKEVEPWMTEKLTVASKNIEEVLKVIQFGS